MVAFTEDLTEFFDTDDFAVEAYFNSSAAPISGLLDQGYNEVLGIEGSQPIFTCRAADVDGVAQGDTLDIGTDSYTIASVEPDGFGVVRLRLEVASI